ncbi:hypothetical protein EC988_006629 [Linderina pennispora]|nr:hypothetical protein EC988_006629 [Linderina pennispora]
MASTQITHSQHMHTYLLSILSAAVAVFGAEEPPARTPLPAITLTMETTYRPGMTTTASDTRIFTPLPFTPNLRHIINSATTEPSVVNIMRNAHIQTYDDRSTARDEL